MHFFCLACLCLYNSAPLFRVLLYILNFEAFLIPLLSFIHLTLGILLSTSRVYYVHISFILGRYYIILED